MAEPRWLRAFYAAAIVLYPLLIYFGLQTVDPRWLTILVVLIAARHVLGSFFPVALRTTWAICVMVLVAVTLLTGSETGLLLYPVLVSLLMFLLFFASWLKPPTVIEMIGRMRDPERPERAIRYTRNLTLVWCAFFVVNGGIALATLALSREWWTLYNGLISYLLLGALFFGELLFRRRLLEQ